MITVDQPKKYGSKQIAKSRALLTILKGPTNDDPSPNKIWIACFGNDSHYERESGICDHVEAVSIQLKEWWRQRSRYLPFGDSQEQEYAKVPKLDPKDVSVRLEIKGLDGLDGAAKS